MSRLFAYIEGAKVQLNKELISIGTTFNYDIPLSSQLDLLERAGFRYVSLGARVVHSGYLAGRGRNKIKKMLADHGMRVCSLHTPFDKQLDISSPHPSAIRKTIDCYKQCMDAAFDLGARVVIFHPTAYMQFDDLASRKRVIVDNVSCLLDDIDDTDIRLAIENEHFPPANEILGYSLDVIADARYGFCYDTSHDNLTGHPLEILRRFGHRLLTTHISDNLSENDDHMLPYEGTFPWPDFCRIFSKLRFNGVFLLEVEMRESSLTSPAEFVHEAFTRGQYLMSAALKK